MKYLVLRKEKSIEEIADRVFRKLTPKQRENAEAELLKANPKLKSFRSIRKGYLVRIPEMRASGKKDRRQLVAPETELSDTILSRIQHHEKSLARKFEAAAESQARQAAILKASNRLLKKLPNGDAASKALNKRLAEEKKLHQNNRAQAEKALEQIKKTFDDTQW
jgi:hypothetical protein